MAETDPRGLRDTEGKLRHSEPVWSGLEEAMKQADHGCPGGCGRQAGGPGKSLLLTPRAIFRSHRQPLRGVTRRQV